jgi:hypothetical protein
VATNPSFFYARILKYMRALTPHLREKSNICANPLKCPLLFLIKDKLIRMSNVLGHKHHRLLGNEINGGDF